MGPTIGTTCTTITTGMTLNGILVLGVGGKDAETTAKITVGAIKGVVRGVAIRTENITKDIEEILAAETIVMIMTTIGTIRAIVTMVTTGAISSKTSATVGAVGRGKVVPT